MRLIDADRLMTKQMQSVYYHLPNGDTAIPIIDIEHAPTIEVPEIVMCKDCVNCVKEPNGDLYCDVLAVGYEPLGSKKVNEDWFCADGERRTDDA